MLSLLLLLAALADTPRTGRVAIVAEPFVFEPALASSLSPAERERITIRIESEARSTIDPFANAGSPSTAFVLDMQRVRPGDDQFLPPRVSSAACIVLEGGTWLDWWFALRPYGKSSALGRALVLAHARGAHLVGIGPAGAHLAARSILARDTLGRIRRDPHATTLDVNLGGIGVGGSACVDFATDGRVDPERLLEVAFDGDLDLAVWLAGPCAWIEDLDTHTVNVEARGGTAYVFDKSSARRSRNHLEGVRVSRLEAGAVFDLSTRTASARAAPHPERSVTNSGLATPHSFFSPRAAHNSWISGKALELKGERHVLRIEFGAGPNEPRGDHAAVETDRAWLDWKPIVR